MRRGILGSITALVIGAGSAWGQGPAPIAQAGDRSMPVMYGDVIPASGPNPTLMPPLAVGPPGDPQGIGPTAGLGPPPGPMYPMPGPYGATDVPAAADSRRARRVRLMTARVARAASGRRRTGGSTANTCCGIAKAPAGRLPTPDDQCSLPERGPRASPARSSSSLGNHIPYGAISGFRLGSGFFGDADRRFGALVTGFYTEQKGVNHLFATSAPSA